MTKTSNTITRRSEEPTTDYAERVEGFLTQVGIYASIPESNKSTDFYSNLIRDLLKNYYNGMHGGAVAAIAEKVAIACARTVLAEGKEISLGELSICYLSAAPQNEVVVDGSVVKSCN